MLESIKEIMHLYFIFITVINKTTCIGYTQYTAL